MSFPIARINADDLWSEAYFRGVDTSGEISDEEEESLDSHCLEFMKQYEVDLALLALTPDRYEGLTLEEAARMHYDECEFGYGPDRDGFMMIWDIESDEVLIEAYGRAENLISRNYLDFTEESVAKYREDYGIYGPLYATYRMLSNYMEGKVEDPERPAGQTEAENETDISENDALSVTEQDENLDETLDAVNTEADEALKAMESDNPETSGNSALAAPIKESGEDTAAETDGTLNVQAQRDPNMPDWYPADPKSFVPFHDEEAKRVVDDADIFTDEQEATMEARLSEIREELSKDIVIFTDVSTHGLSREVYAADFYDFNGYGIGPEYEGACLLICMDPDNRGGWCCCSGSETRALYTEYIANLIDDMLYAYLGEGAYYAAVSNWIENFRNLYLTGSPYLSDWALQSKEFFTRFHNEDAPRVIDNARILTIDELNALTAEAKALSDDWQTDIVIFTSPNGGGLSIEDLTEKYYYFNGYGYGDDYSGIMLTVYRRNGTDIDSYVRGFGKSAEILTETNSGRLAKRCKNTVLWGDFNDALTGFLDQTKHMFETGRVPRSMLSWSVTLILELLAGFIFAGVSLSKARKKMETPVLKENADTYLVKNSLIVSKVSDRFIRTDKNRVYDPVTRSSGGSSSSSGGRSSYSSSYSGSSGRSHSGSGRSF
ncbi:MAG: TPM domain-containing protein [Lachnospiraceae bacterium]|nr:TPM domain-containing protein [Lachnospiraceae bacterium]